MSCELPECACRLERKAIKAHTCYECRGRINPGERYVHVSGIWGGEPARYKFCPECDALWKEVMDNYDDPEDSDGYGQLYQEIFDGSDLPKMKRYVDNAERRGGSLGKDNWMLKRITEINNTN